MKIIYLFSLSCFLFLVSDVVDAQVFSGKYGKVKFTSSASHGLIVGHSLSLRGQVDLQSGHLIFEQPLNNFYFFHGEKQKRSAERDVLETEKFPLAFFRGKLINDFTARFENGRLAQGCYPFTAIGKLSIHGVVNEVKVLGECVVDDATITFKAQFRIYLSDFSMALPRLSTQQVSEEVHVSIDIKMGRQAG